jgi:hypothetical protein
LVIDGFPSGALDAAVGDDADQTKPIAPSV